MRQLTELGTDTVAVRPRTANLADVARMNETYCPHELLTGTCGTCAPSAEAKAFDNPAVVRHDGTWAIARFAAVCGCGCEGRIEPGDDIVLGSVDGADAWCLQEHTRSTSGGW